MLSFLKNHPFAVEAFFEYSLVLTFAVPKAQLQGMIPECLELDLFNEKWGFIAVAMVQTTGLRPKGFPALFGNDFFLTGYRLFVRYTNNAGKRLRGLYILKSETDKRSMNYLGKIFTQYRYTITDIKQTNLDNKRIIHSVNSGFTVITDEAAGEAALPAASPFRDWKSARKFAGPLPFTFTYNAGKKQVLIIEGVRQNWKPEPVKVVSYTIPFMNELQLPEIVLASAFRITNIPYYWKKGKTEVWRL